MNQNEKNTNQIDAVIYDKENIMEAIKALDSVTVTGISQCFNIVNIAQRLNASIKEEKMNIDIE